MVHFGEFVKLEACGQTVLPDRSFFIGQKLMENAIIEKIFRIFHKMSHLNLDSLTFSMYKFLSF